MSIELIFFHKNSDWTPEIHSLFHNWILWNWELTVNFAVLQWSPSKWEEWLGSACSLTESERKDIFEYWKQRFLIWRNRKWPGFTLWTPLDHQLFLHSQLQATVKKYGFSAPGMVYFHYTYITYSYLSLSAQTVQSLPTCLYFLCNY